MKFRSFFVDLNRAYPFQIAHSDIEEEDVAAAEAEWDTELSKRMKDVEEGRVQLLSGQESEKRMDAMFAKHGLQRRTA